MVLPLNDLAIGVRHPKTTRNYREIVDRILSAVLPGTSGRQRQRGPEVGGEEGDRVSVRSYRSSVGGLVSLVQPGSTPDGPDRPGTPFTRTRREAGRVPGSMRAQPLAPT